MRDIHRSSAESAEIEELKNPKLEESRISNAGEAQILASHYSFFASTCTASLTV